MSLKLQPKQVPVQIFRAYDVRGIVDQDLTEDFAHDLGVAFASEMAVHNRTSIVVGRDARLTGGKLFKALVTGLTDSGVDVVDVGLVPTPLLYFATYHLGIDCGIMITGSHNPPDYNGFKMIIAGETVSGDKVQQLCNRLLNADVITADNTGTVSARDIQDAYLERVASTVTLNKPLKVVIDAGNGIAGEIAPKLFAMLGCDVVPLFCQVDGSFPNHHPDPSRPENLLDLKAKMAETKADIGLAFDGDADRLGVVTPSGHTIYPDRQMMLYARHVLKENPGGKIVFDVKCSKYLSEVITEAGGEPVLYKTGHSLIKGKLKEVGAVLGGEMSGHIFFNDRWYGFDDAIYTGARLLEMVAVDGRDVDTIFSDIPEAVSTPEINVKVPEQRKFALVEELIRDVDFKDANIITIDGLRVEFANGWGLIRASNTSPNLVLRFEADDEQSLWDIQVLLRDFLLEHQPDLDVPLQQG